MTDTPRRPGMAGILCANARTGTNHDATPITRINTRFISIASKETPRRVLPSMALSGRQQQTLLMNGRVTLASHVFRDDPRHRSRRWSTVSRSRTNNTGHARLGRGLLLGRERRINLRWIDVIEVIADRLECDADEQFQHLRREIAGGEERVDRLLAGVSTRRDQFSR